MLALKYITVVTMVAAASGAAIPIWELLTRQEKLGRLMYVFLHLVDDYCTDSNIPDCQKVLTLYGLSNLVNAEDNSLDEMDPYHYNSRGFIWKKVMKGDFKLPSLKNFDSEASDSDYELGNEVDDYPRLQRPLKATNDPHPYAVRVPAPPKATPIARVPAPARATPLVGGSSHPHAVWVPPAGIKPSADFEPMMTESRVQPTVVRAVLPPRNLAMLRSRRDVPAFPEQEMKQLVSMMMGQ
ncbi:hypothetical protein Pcinc_013695 [Petrolisthes cinctipes]|uniref:Rhythmically expressed gene 5 protein n=1 Tax=Petrolisthes cinctipes TaxID=88211 RepID=A0AAE1FYK7_PETCI|nr:hypothetical protein Pcinc_013695 [Petrolisthes cinctipes]